MENYMRYEDIKEIWIEAEQWSEGFSAENEISDVLVYTVEGKQWVGTFVTTLKVKESMEDWYENDIERHFWVSDMIIIECLDRVHIEAAIKKMLEEGNFKSAFSEYEDYD